MIRKTAQQFSVANRERKWRLFLETIAPSSAMTLLNVGYTNREFSPSDNLLEKLYPYPERITALGIEEPTEYARRYPSVRVVKYDGTRFPFPDKAFDVCWSNAVLEHVGDADRQLLFLSEIARVARRAFVTTPNRYFPVEVHTLTPLLHYLPKDLFDRYLKIAGKGWATGSYMNLLGERDLRHLLEMAGCGGSRIVRNRLLGFTVDFVAVIGA
jgi:SAM-dependent methyltransferase